MDELKKEIEEQELFKDETDIVEEEEGAPLFDILENMKLEDALVFVGLVGARIRKAPNPEAFAEMYARYMSSFLKLLGFEWALKQTLREIKLNPKVILILGFASMGIGIFVVPVGGSKNELAGGGQVGNRQELLRPAPNEQASNREETSSD